MHAPVAIQADNLKSLLWEGTSPSCKLLGEILLKSEMINREQLDKALEVQAQSQEHQTLGGILMQQGLLSHRQLAQSLSEQFEIPFIDLEAYQVPEASIGKISADTAHRYNMCPLGIAEDSLLVAIDNPCNNFGINAAGFDSGMHVVPVIADGEQIKNLIQSHYENHEVHRLAKLSLLNKPDDANNHHSTEESISKYQIRLIEEQANKAPMVKMVNLLIGNAIHQRASDIHIRPNNNTVSLKYRIDGTLIAEHHLNIELLPALVSRIKIIANMNIAERRVPQDGHVPFTHRGKVVDLRVSIIPTVKGESTVIRILDPDEGVRSVEDLGLAPDNRQRFDHLSNLANGIFLVTGPTGCGKSTTLYAILNNRICLNRHIITVEDPVEYHIDGCEQIQVNPQIGYDFADALKHILRHDPDDILIGEMRDQETTKIAIKASLTGHYVMSTLHTNDAASSISRLLDLGIDPSLIASSLRGVMAQRLVRCLCRKCRKPVVSSEQQKIQFKLTEQDKLYEAEGCKHCHHTGYSGRRLVCEIMYMDAELTEAILAGSSAQQLHQLALKQGMKSIDEDGLALVKQGLIGLSELGTVQLHN